MTEVTSRVCSLPSVMSGIRVNSKPVYMVYKTNLLPDPIRTSEIWREAVRREGLGEIYLVRIENYFQGYDPAPDEIGFDAAVEFAPHWGSFGPQVNSDIELYPEAAGTGPLIYEYDNVMTEMLCSRLKSHDTRKSAARRQTSPRTCRWKISVPA